MAKVNCAVYVRKSTEKGLELEFNSLHNQEDACRNYILSQSFNNWEYYKTYTDGGISGGTMERPALQQMLDDISKGLIQTVVVYKIDRLSRSIMDFHNMMTNFDKYNCNFVSITQAFDTSTSMGKLTLNMLLSFAQFEREVSSERVKDKLRAQKAKGFWTGGVPKLGYEIVDKKLVVNPEEAKTVNRIFEMYLSVGSLLELSEALNAEGITQKKWITSDGVLRGGQKFRANIVGRILRDKVYTGQIENKRAKESYQGLHEAIIQQELFDAAQQKLDDQNKRNTDEYRSSLNLLTSKLFNATGEVFKNQATSRKRKINKRYYAIKGLYLPSDQVERQTKLLIKEILDANLDRLGRDTSLLLKQINFDGMGYLRQRDFTTTFINKIIYANDKMTLFLNLDKEVLKAFIDPNFLNQQKGATDYLVDETNKQIIVERTVYFQKGISSNVYNAGRVGFLNATENNHLIVRSLAYAWKYKKMYEDGLSTHEISTGEGIAYRTIYKYLNLAYLSPKIINALMDGALTIDMQKLFAIASKYERFDDQEKVILENKPDDLSFHSSSIHTEQNTLQISQCRQ